MTYDTPQALRMSLEHRLLTRSEQTGAPVDRLRRRVMFERIVARLQLAEPGSWVLKGGMALEVRLGDDARLTKDIDLGLRTLPHAASDLRDRVITALGRDVDNDGFAFAVAPPKRMAPDGADVLTYVGGAIRAPGAGAPSPPRSGAQAAARRREWPLGGRALFPQHGARRSDSPSIPTLLRQILRLLAAA